MTVTLEALKRVPDDVGASGITGRGRERAG